MADDAHSPRRATGSGADPACSTIRPLLAGFAHDELDSADAAGVRAHLEACFACARELGGFLRAVRGLRAGLTPPPLPDGFFDALRTDILTRVVAAGRMPLRASRLRKVSAAAAALVLLGLGLVAGQWSQPAPGLLHQPALTLDPGAAGTAAPPGSDSQGSDGWSNLLVELGYETPDEGPDGARPRTGPPPDPERRHRTGR